MNRDPTKVGRAKVGAELIAEVVNGFVEPISWKTLVRHRAFVHLRIMSWNDKADLSAGFHPDFLVISHCFREQFVITLPLAAQPNQYGRSSSTFDAHVPDRCTHSLSATDAARRFALGEPMDR